MKAEGARASHVLKVALGLNAAMFVVGLAAGLVAESLGLIADSLDMLADAFAYGLSLAAIGRAPLFKAKVARMSGTLLLLLGAGVVADVARRVWTDSSPEGGVIIVTAALSLVVNTYVITTLSRFRTGEVHLRTAWLFTRADVVANLGVVAAGLAVMLTGSRYPDLVAGFAIGCYVMWEATTILRNARRARAAANAT